MVLSSPGWPGSSDIDWARTSRSMLPGERLAETCSALIERSAATTQSALGAREGVIAFTFLGEHMRVVDNK